MDNVTGDIARAAAAAPLSPKQDAPKTTGKGNPLLAVLGAPTFLAGDGRTYPRTSGWGANKKPHPDGGTNETVAFVIFKPFKGLETGLEGRIYCERYMENGKQMRSYSVSIPFFKPQRGDAAGRDAAEALKVHIRDAYRSWQGTDAAKESAAKAKRTVSADKWVESDAPDA
jgi:hypothetical protein